jgi:hypothetical protein
MIDFFQLREKAVSQAQQKMMGMALAYKRGEMDDASPEVKKMADSMSMKDLEDFAKTKHKGLPVKKEEVEQVDESRMSSDAYVVAVKDPKGWKVVFSGSKKDQSKEIKKMKADGKVIGKDFRGYMSPRSKVGDIIKEYGGPKISRDEYIKKGKEYHKEEQDPLLADENPVTENGQDFFQLREKLSEQILAHGGKGQYKAVKKGGVVNIMYKGKKVGTADYDSGADAFFASIKGVKGQKDFDTAQDMVDYFAKNKITEELLHEKKDSYPLYHKTYSDAMAAAYAYAKKQGYEVDMDDVDRKVASGPRKPSNGKTNSFTLKLKGEKRKMLAVQVTNLDNKRYELNTYIT